MSIKFPFLGNQKESEDKLKGKELVRKRVTVAPVPERTYQKQPKCI
jgi:hypothetical protein